MRTYLSLDLDFFNAVSNEVYPVFMSTVEHHLEEISKFIKSRGTPCVAVMNHQQMLRFVDDSGCDTLLNVDTHSDLAEANVDEFSCGTWVSYVKWRREGRYIWRHGYTAFRGDCSGNVNLFGPRPARERGVLSGWKNVAHVRTRNMPELTEDIQSIGICLSPSYVDFPEETGEVLRGWAKKNNVPYVKGRIDEHFGVRRKPR